jgi:hypothetical protein
MAMRRSPLRRKRRESSQSMIKRTKTRLKFFDAHSDIVFHFMPLKGVTWSLGLQREARVDWFARQDTA